MASLLNDLLGAVSPSEAFRSLRLPESPGGVLVQEARDQRLVGEAFLERSFLDRLQILGRNPNVEAAIFLEGRLRSATVSAQASFGRARRPPLAAINGVEKFLLVSLKLHDRPLPSPNTASWPSDSE